MNNKSFRYANYTGDIMVSVIYVNTFSAIYGILNFDSYTYLQYVKISLTLLKIVQINHTLGAVGHRAVYQKQLCTTLKNMYNICCMNLYAYVTDYRLKDMRTNNIKYCVKNAKCSLYTSLSLAFSFLSSIFFVINCFPRGNFQPLKLFPSVPDFPLAEPLSSILFLFILSWHRRRIYPVNFKVKHDEK